MKFFKPVSKHAADEMEAWLKPEVALGEGNIAKPLCEHLANTSNVL